MSQQPWWHDAVVYEVYPRSFADSDGDGTGDLDGVTAHLDHLVDLGVDALWLTPFYVSPMHDGGYDVADPMDVDPLFGDLAAFDRLLAAAHDRNLKLIVDVVPNHLSTEHPWFTSGRKELFWFRETTNNWESTFTGPAWTRTDDGDFYLHMFDASQPDLDWDQPEVHTYFEGVLRFWLDRGVDGFRIDVAMGLYKNRALTDIPAGYTTADSRGGEAPVQVWNQPDVLDVYASWHRLLDTYEGDRMLVGEVFLMDVDQVVPYTQNRRLHQAFNFSVMATPFDAVQLRETIEQALARFDSPTWVLSNHDLVRHVTRYDGGRDGLERGLALTALLLALPGSPYLYQGEELALQEADVPADARQDPVWLRQKASGVYDGTVGRDGCRTPLPWDGTPNRGFTTGVPWLPFGPDATSVGEQASDPASPLSVYRRLLATRRGQVRGLARDVEWLTWAPGCIHLRRAGQLDVLANLGDVAVALDAPMQVLATTHGPEQRPILTEIPPRTTVWALQA